MKAKDVLGLLLAAAALLVAAVGCNVSNVEYHGWAGYGMREQPSPVFSTMLNQAFKKMTLPEGAVASGDYVAVYRLSSGEGEDPWWAYLAEDALVDKVRKAGASALERNDEGNELLLEEGKYFPPPKNGKAGLAAGAPASPRENVITPYRATRALEYRLVSAYMRAEPVRTNGGYSGGKTIITDDAIITPGAIITDDAIIAGPPGHGRERGVLMVTCEVTLNLRTADVRTGEVLWSGPVSGVAAAKVPVHMVYPYAPYDWDDWEDEYHGPWIWYWDWQKGPSGPPPEAAPTAPDSGAPPEAAPGAGAPAEEESAPWAFTP